MTTAPLINPQSPRARTLHAQLDFQGAVNRVLLATTRPLDRTTHRPLLSDAELEEMEVACAAGLSPEGFAARLMARDKQAARVEARG